MIYEIMERYWAKVDRADGDRCWYWTGSKTLGGYGQFFTGSFKRRRGIRTLATHVALALDGRMRPSPNHVAMHRCDTPPCVNPAHLRWGTLAENSADMSAKGRSYRQKLASAEMDEAARRLGDTRLPTKSPIMRETGRFCRE